MTYFKVYEQKRIISRQTGEVVLLSKDSPFDANEMLIVPPQCLIFDKHWDRIPEACSFLDSRLNSKRQEWNTVEAKMYAVKLFYDFLEDIGLEFNQVDVKEINDFIAWLFRGEEMERFVMGKTTSRTEKTVNTYISHIRDFYKYLRFTHNIHDPFKEEYEEINRPSAQPKGFYAHTLSSGKVGKSMFKVKERGKKTITILGQSEIQSLVNAAGRRNRLMILLMVYTGMRVGEILNLKVDAIGVPDMASDVQRLPMIPNESDGKRRKLKTGTRDIFLPPWLMKMLEDYYSNVWINLVDANGLKHDYFFVSEGNRSKGLPLSYNGVKSMFEKLFQATGVDANPHDFRHTYATNLARLKIDIRTLMEMLGHKHPDTVAIYIRMAEIEDVTKILADFYSTYDIGMGQI